MVTLNCPNLHFSIPQEDILNDNSSEAMLQSCHRMSGLPLRRKPLRHNVQLLKFRHQRHNRFDLGSGTMPAPIATYNSDL